MKRFGDRAPSTSGREPLTDSLVQHCERSLRRPRQWLTEDKVMRALEREVVLNAILAHPFRLRPSLQDLSRRRQEPFEPLHRLSRERELSRAIDSPAVDGRAILVHNEILRGVGEVTAPRVINEHAWTQRSVLLRDHRENGGHCSDRDGKAEQRHAYGFAAHDDGRKYCSIEWAMTATSTGMRRRWFPQRTRIQLIEFPSRRCSERVSGVPTKQPDPRETKANIVTNATTGIASTRRGCVCLRRNASAKVDAQMT